MPRIAGVRQVTLAIALCLALLLAQALTLSAAPPVPPSKAYPEAQSLARPTGHPALEPAPKLTPPHRVLRRASGALGCRARRCSRWGGAG